MNKHYLSSRTMIDPNTGSFLYNTPTSISLYVPELKMGFRTSGGRAEGWDFSNPENATRLWRSDQHERTASLNYANGKIFWGGSRIDHYFTALDAKTGAVLWEVLTYCNDGLAAGYGKVFVASNTFGICAYEENTGKLVWQFAQRALYVYAGIAIIIIILILVISVVWLKSKQK